MIVSLNIFTPLVSPSSFSTAFIPFFPSSEANQSKYLKRIPVIPLFPKYQSNCFLSPFHINLCLGPLHLILRHQDMVDGTFCQKEFFSDFPPITIHHGGFIELEFKKVCQTRFLRSSIPHTLS